LDDLIPTVLLRFRTSDLAELFGDYPSEKRPAARFHWASVF